MNITGRIMLSISVWQFLTTFLYKIFLRKISQYFKSWLLAVLDLPNLFLHFIFFYCTVKANKLSLSREYVIVKSSNKKDFNEEHTYYKNFHFSGNIFQFRSFASSFFFHVSLDISLSKVKNFKFSLAEFKSIFPEW